MGICLVVEIVQFIVGSVLFFILFFGIAFIINMLVRQTWVITLLYPFIIILVVGKYSFLDYFTQPGNAFPAVLEDRKSTRLNSSHVAISYAVFCLKKKITTACHYSI